MSRLRPSSIAVCVILINVAFSCALTYEALAQEIARAHRVRSGIPTRIMIPATVWVFAPVALAQVVALIALRRLNSSNAGYIIRQILFWFGLTVLWFVYILITILT